MSSEQNMRPSAKGTPRKRLSRVRFGAAGLMFVAGIGLLNMQACQTGGRYLNHDPEVQYVGIQACQECHAEIHETYIRTGMGRSFYRPTRQNVIEAFGPEALVRDTAGNFWYRPLWRGDSMYVLEYRMQGPDTVYQRLERVDYVVGSGHQTRSYMLERNGFFYEMPITWYEERRLWDLSPGYHEGNNSRFSREIGQECMACHNGHSEHEPGTVNRFRRVALGIDCENCHGPGQAHVARMEAGDEVDVSQEIDYSIVNPGKLPPALQFDVCQQCHLQGVNVPTGGPFRPGMPLASAFEVFVVQEQDPNRFGIASHAARLQRSPCFLKSNGSLTCTRCHDPHVSHREQGADFYNAQCQTCHGRATAPGLGAQCPEQPAARQAVQDNCITCHMPKGATSDIPHVSFSDHYIRVVRPASEAASHNPALARQQRLAVQLLCATSPNPPPAHLAMAQLLYFERHAPTHRQLLAQASLHLPDTANFAWARLLYYNGRLPEALQRIGPVVQQRPTDTWALYFKAQVLAAQNQTQPAIAVYEKVFALNPWITEAAVQAAALWLQLAQQGNAGAPAHARRLLQAALSAKPSDKRALANLGFLLMNQRQTDQARLLLLRALALDPDYETALQNLASLEAAAGNPALAQHYRQRLARIAPIVD